MISKRMMYASSWKFSIAKFSASTDLVQTNTAYQSSFENIIVEQKEPGVALITLNRPQALNALNDEMITDLNRALGELDRDPEVRAIVLTGTERAFAAGGDIKRNTVREWPETFMNNMLKPWDQVSKLRTPLIGAVNGYALGGGAQLAMMCDILIAGQEAKFGQSEINHGVIPGVGGTQRLTRAIGKSRAMEICLTGDMIGAEEAAQRGLVSRVVPVH